MKLYETNGHIKEFEATVLSCEKNSDGNYDIVLNQTAFFPEGGGQSSDDGTIDENKVLKLRLTDDSANVIHTISSPKAIGSKVFCQIDMDKRFSDMQNHTAEHIVSGIIHSLYGYDNIGFHMGENEITMDFNGILDKKQLDDIEMRANKVVYDNVPINISFISPENADKVFFRSKKEINSTIRLVEIEGVDVCACCAPHVLKTGEIGIIKLIGVQKYKGGIRISMLAGQRAYLEMKKHFDNVKSISTSLSSHPDKIVDNFKLLQNEISQLKCDKSSIKEKYYTLLSEKYSSEDKLIVIFEDNSDINDLRKLVNILMEKTDGICAAFSKIENKPYSFVIGSKTADLADLQRIMKTELNASGGGRNTMIQGSVSTSEEKIKALFNSYIS